jgi:hypothetical protein
VTTLYFARLAFLVLLVALAATLVALAFRERR